VVAEPEIVVGVAALPFVTDHGEAVRQAVSTPTASTRKRARPTGRDCLCVIAPDPPACAALGRAAKTYRRRPSTVNTRTRSPGHNALSATVF
jgi:hypothetical protein